MRPFACVRRDLTQFEYGFEHDKAVDQVELAFMQRLAGDTAAQRLLLNRRALYSTTPQEINPARRMQRGPYGRSVSSLCHDGEEGFGSKGSGMCNHAYVKDQKCIGRTWLQREPGANSDDRRRT